MMLRHVVIPPPLFLGLTFRTWFYIVQIIIFLLSGLGVAVRAQSKHQVTADDLLSLKHGVFPEQLSPNGQLLAYSLGEDIWLVRTQQGSVPRKLGRGRLPVWAPGGQRFAYYSDESGSFQLWVFDLATNKAAQVTEIVGGVDPDARRTSFGLAWEPLRQSWSPDGTKLAFTSRVVAGPASSMDSWKKGTTSDTRVASSPLVLTTETPPEWTLGGIFVKAFDKAELPATFYWQKKNDVRHEWQPSPPMTNQLFVVDIESKKTTQLTKDDFGYFEPEWAPDGQRIVCVSNEGKYFNMMRGDGTNLYLVDVASGHRTALTTSISNKWMPSYSPNGRYIAFSSSLNVGTRSVLVVPSVGGNPVNITSELDRSVMERVWSPDSGSIVVQYTDGVSNPIARVEIFGKGIQSIEHEAASRQGLTISRSGVLAWQQSDGSSAGVIRILPFGESSSYVLIEFNPQIKEWALGEQEVVRWKNHRGDEMDGVLIKPVAYHPGHSYPLIVEAYPIHGSGFKDWLLAGNQVWAARGYAVFMPESRTPHTWTASLKSEAYTQAGKGPKGWDVTMDDVMSGVEELIRRGVVDSERMGLFGFSSGGGVVNYLVTRTSRFKCAVSVSPAWSDWVRDAMLTATASVVAEKEGGELVWDNPDAYIQLSAVFHLNKVKTPMLLAAGDEDGDSLLDNIEMYNGLRQYGQNVTLLRYPDQGHEFIGAALKDFWERENTFFDKYLKPEPSPN
jgi:dipeptidyl aminopeptidase/acylaminoacyl peptidase